MNRQRLAARLLFYASALLWAGFIYLTFFLPRQVAVWKDFGEALSRPTRVLIRIGDVVRTFPVWVFVLALLFAMTLGSVVWYFAAGSKERPGTGEEQEER